MMKIKANGVKLIAMLVFLMAGLLAVSGCSALRSKQGATNSTGAVSTQPVQTKTVYLDFGDVLLPKELKVEKDSSFVFSTAGLTAGVLSLKGRVESNSLITFFENRMPEDGWQMISAIKAERSMLLFKKQARWCVIGIEEGQMSTFVQIWVAPTMAPESGLLK
jgi:hypothetical protein